jgi:hypothetical protein
MQPRIVTVFAAAAALGLVFACTVKSEPGGGSSSTRDGGSSSGTSGNTSSSGDSGTKGDPAVCKGTADINACETCCGISDETIAPLDNAYIACICDDKCKTECGSTYCTENGAEPNQACIDCLNREEQGCDTKSKTECNKDSKCKAFLACANEACTDKQRDAGP